MPCKKLGAQIVKNENDMFLIVWELTFFVTENMIYIYIYIYMGLFGTMRDRILGPNLSTVLAHKI